MLFLDRASGKLASRPQLDAAMKHLRAGDVLVITRLDLLGRSVKHLAERELIVERTVDGLDASRARGRAGGRKPTLTPAAVRQVQAMYDSGAHTVEEIAKAFKTTRPTIYRATAAPGSPARRTQPTRSAPRRRWHAPDTAPELPDLSRADHRPGNRRATAR